MTLDKHELTIKSWYGSENTEIEGTIGDHTLRATGSAGDHGTHAEVDGEAQWWCGPDHPGELEAKIEELFEDAWAAIEEKYGEEEVERGWLVKMKDGEVVKTALLCSNCGEETEERVECDICGDDFCRKCRPKGKPYPNGCG